MRGRAGPRAVFGRVVVGKRARSAAYVSGLDETLPARDGPALLAPLAVRGTDGGCSLSTSDGADREHQRRVSEGAGGA